MEWTNVSHVVAEAGRAPEPFCISTFPVTVEQFSAFLLAGGYRRPEFWSPEGWRWRESVKVSQPAYWNQEGYGDLDLPVTGVSYWESEAFAEFCGARIPSEAEWRAVATNAWTTAFPWGDGPSSELRANTGFFDEGKSRPLTPVKAFPAGASGAGVWDLLGNVAEWCERDLQDAHNDVGVLCGGSRWNPPEVVDSWFRDELCKSTRDNQTGIRLVMGRRSAIRQPASIVTEGQASTVARASQQRPIKRPSDAFRQEGVPNTESLLEWRLRVSGQVETPLDLTLRELQSNFPQVEFKGTFVCVCRWADITSAVGVLLSDVLAASKPRLAREELFVLQSSWPGKDGRRYTSCLSASDHDFAQILLCYSLNGSPLTPELGAPLRTICFGLYGYKQVKCVAELHVQREFQNGWWEQKCGYDPVGNLKAGTACLVGPKPQRINIYPTV